MVALFFPGFAGFPTMTEENVANVDISCAIDKVEGLATQSLLDLDFKTLSPLTHNVMSRQATINVGTIGHVAHGKSTVVKAISDVRTMTFKREAEMNLTIHLGYANAKIFKCPDCPAPDCYHAYGSKQPDKSKCPKCDAEMTLQRHVSLVDCPGHDILMATMLNGAAIMDAAMLLVAANETFPQPQTLEHLKAVEIMQLAHVIVLQNKIDLVKEHTALEQYSQIKAYLKNTSALNSPVVPISAQLKYNVDLVLDYLCHLPIPQRKFDVPLRMIVVRSFDVNRPGPLIFDDEPVAKKTADDKKKVAAGEEGVELQGGVAGGTVQEGIIKIGMTVEIRPGLRRRTQAATGETVFTCEPIKSKVKTLNSEKVGLLYAVPGGLIGVGTNIDPSLTRQNKLVGNLIGTPDTLPDVYSDIEVEYSLFTQLVGVKQSGGKATKVSKLTVGESLQINIGSLTTAGNVAAVQTTPAAIVRVVLHQPVCASMGTSVAISRRFVGDKGWRLIGWGRVVRGVPVELVMQK